jgi:hypothetical protein
MLRNETSMGRNDTLTAILRYYFLKIIVETSSLKSRYFGEEFLHL